MDVMKIDDNTRKTKKGKIAKPKSRVGKQTV